MKKTGKIWDTSILNILARQELKRARQTNLASIRAAVSAPSVVDIVRPPASTSLDVLNEEEGNVSEHDDVSCLSLDAASTLR